MRLKTIDGKYVDDGINDDSIEIIPECADALAKVIKYMQDIFDSYEVKLDVRAMRGFGTASLELEFVSEGDFLLTFAQIADMLEIITPDALHIHRDDTENGVVMRLEFADIYRKKQ